MNLINKTIEKKLGIFHWNIGFIEAPFAAITNGITQPIHWLQHQYNDRFFADPFILQATEDTIDVLVEEFLYTKWKGRISLLTVSRKDYRLLNRKIVLELETHLSFPYIYRESDKIFVIPENSLSGSLHIYPYNPESQTLGKPAKIIDEPIVDPTLIKLNDMYYLVCTSLKYDENRDLLLYHSNNLTGPYIPFTENPVKQDITSARPGGGFYFCNDRFYRCTQNSQNSYGASLNICEVESIEKDLFKEQKRVNILPDSEYRHGLHTLDSQDNICVVDGLRYLYNPIFKLKRKLTSLR